MGQKKHVCNEPSATLEKLKEVYCAPSDEVLLRRVLSIALDAAKHQDDFDLHDFEIDQDAREEFLLQRRC
jgi:hypothetical protein